MTAEGRFGARGAGELGAPRPLRPVAAEADRERASADGQLPVEADADLAALAIGGDRLAFARLYERYSSTVHGVLLAAGPREEAGDLVQEVFLLALRSISRLAEPKSVGPWLLAIARNRARDAHKSRKPVVEMPAGLEPAAPDAPEPGAESGDDLEAKAALEAVRSLPEAYRETLVLRLVEGLSGPEIAARTGLTHGSVRVNLHRGMKLLRERLSRGGGR